MFLFNLVAIIFILSSCSKDVVRGRGSIGSRTLNLPAFSAVESHYDISADISYGAVQAVTITGYDNLLNILDVRVDGDVLKLKYNSNYINIRNGNLVAKIIVPVINKATIHGSRQILIAGFINGDSLNAKIHGSANIRVSNSSFQSALLEIYGSGDIDAQGLQAKQVEVKVHGSGNTSVSVTERMKASIFGSGNVYYWGNPAIETTQNGSGRIIKR